MATTPPAKIPPDGPCPTTEEQCKSYIYATIIGWIFCICLFLIVLVAGLIFVFKEPATTYYNARVGAYRDKYNPSSRFNPRGGGLSDMFV
jgi:hypothetical protein